MHTQKTEDCWPAPGALELGGIQGGEPSSSHSKPCLGEELPGSRELGEETGNARVVLCKPS